MNTKNYPVGRLAYTLRKISFANFRFNAQQRYIQFQFASICPPDLLSIYSYLMDMEDGQVTWLWHLTPDSGIYLCIIFAGFKMDRYVIGICFLNSSCFTLELDCDIWAAIIIADAHCYGQFCDTFAVESSPFFATAINRWKAIQRFLYLRSRCSR